MNMMPWLDISNSKLSGLTEPKTFIIYKLEFLKAYVLNIQSTESYDLNLVIYGLQ